MNYPDSVRFLYSLGNEVQTAKLGLERIRVLLEALGSPHRKGRFVHVAGTNGKGSTCAMIESGLRAAGVRTGLYTSPHLEDPVERIRVRGEPVARDVFARALDEVHECAERLLAEGRIDLHPTYFETVTAMAFLIFAREAEMTVLETGLGGRLDATNVVTPELSVITPVDYDHEAWLGETLTAIAGEKAGILKPDVPGLLARQREEAAREIERRAAATGAPLRETKEWPVERVELSKWSSRFEMAGLEIECPLAGEHQVENARTAAAALELLGVGKRQIHEGIAAARWPGRLERVAENPYVIVDGAHNPAGARALAEYIRRFFTGERLTLIYGTMRDKAVSEITGILFPLFDRVIATAPAQTRALDPEALRGPGVEVARDIESAAAMVGRDETVFVSGSLFLVAEARRLAWRKENHRRADQADGRS